MNNPEKSTWPSRRPISGMITSSTSDDTIFPKAAPMMTPTAKSHHAATHGKFLEFLQHWLSPLFFRSGQQRPGAEYSSLGRAVCGAGYIRRELRTKSGTER